MRTRAYLSVSALVLGSILLLISYCQWNESCTSSAAKYELEMRNYWISRESACIPSPLILDKSSHSIYFVHTQPL
jgi:hypothetical protein